jgi:hypothetical protein
VAIRSALLGLVVQRLTLRRTKNPTPAPARDHDFKVLGQIADILPKPEGIGAEGE